MSKKLYQIIARVLDTDMSKINDKSSPETIENWDSFNGLLLADELESEFKVKFTIDELVAVKNVGDIKIQLTNHGINLND